MKLERRNDAPGTLYREPAQAGNGFRAEMLVEVGALVRARRREADRRRREYFRPDFSSEAGYRRSTVKYREKLADMLGWPLTAPRPAGVPRARHRKVATDSLGRITRVWIETLPGVRTYGLFFRPPGKGPFPLLVLQHGGGGTPELCSSFFGSGNYNDMTRRLLRRGAAVFAPQLLLWNPALFGPEHRKEFVDRRLKQVGGSLAALELYRIRRSLDYLVRRRDIDAQRVGMLGLSYGGFYTLLAAALDRRIRVALSSCFFNNRKVYDANADWIWFDSARHLLDAEIGALVCPRPLYVEVGRQDTLFRTRHARPEAGKLESVYRRLGIPGNFRYHEHEGGHEFDRSNRGIAFLCRHLFRETR